MLPDADEILAQVRLIHALIRDRVVAAGAEQSVDALAAADDSHDGDTIFAIDRISEDLLLELVTEHLGIRWPLVLIADSSARKYSDQATHWLECPVDSVSAFDSYATAMSLMNLLATGAMGAQVRESRTRIAAITSVYEDLDELEAPW